MHIFDLNNLPPSFLGCCSTLEILKKDVELKLEMELPTYKRKLTVSGSRETIDEIYFALNLLCELERTLGQSLEERAQDLRTLFSQIELADFRIKLLDCLKKGDQDVLIVALNPSTFKREIYEY